MDAFALPQKGKYRVHILALGDVGATLLLGMRLLGGDAVSAIGIYDVREGYAARYELEMNQIAGPLGDTGMPKVEILSEQALFQCDVFVFCASAYVPEIGAAVSDVRLAQLTSNARLVSIYARQAAAAGYAGLFAIVSDPVDLLCQCAYYAAQGGDYGAGLKPRQIRGYGLGVMHARALYYAEKDARFAAYAKEGRAFGPHGQDLILANSMLHYDEALSLELTKKTVEANLQVRELGFKPYIAPAISSGVLSLLATMRGDWHYSAIYMGGIYFGCKNRLTAKGTEQEELYCPPPLQERIDAVKARLYEEGTRWRP